MLRRSCLCESTPSVRVVGFRTLLPDSPGVIAKLVTRNYGGHALVHEHELGVGVLNILF